MDLVFKKQRKQFIKGEMTLHPGIYYNHRTGQFIPAFV